MIYFNYKKKTLSFIFILTLLTPSLHAQAGEEPSTQTKDNSKLEILEKTKGGSEVIEPYLMIIIAAIVAFIGLLQYLNSRKQKLISEEKLKLDFFDRRFKVYENTKSLLNLVKNKTHGERGNGGECTIVPRVENGYFDELMEFKRATAPARFLFRGDTIHKYVEKINKEAESLHLGSYIEKKYLDSREWLLKQLDEIENIFAPHLEFDFKA